MGRDKVEVDLNKILGKEFDQEFTDWDSSMFFDLSEACSLLYREVIHNEDRDQLPKPSISKSGIVVGVLTMNEEIEVLVKFSNQMEQLTKTEFCGDFTLVSD